LLPAFSFPQIPVVAASVRDLVRGRQAVARMVIGLRKAYGKPFVSYATNPHFTGASWISPFARVARVYIPFIATLKPPFKLDRP
jgi:hypothetical protein